VKRNIAPAGVHILAPAVALSALLILAGGARAAAETQAAAAQEAPAPTAETARSPEAIQFGPRSTPSGRSTAQRGTADNGLGLGQVVWALAVVMALIFAMRWVGRHWFATSPSGSAAVTVLSRIPIAPRQQLLLLQVGRRLVLVGNTGAAMSALCEITDADEVAGLLGLLRQRPQESLASSFRSLFGRASSAYQTNEAPVEAGKQPEASDVELESTRAELSELMCKVRTVARQLNRG
jgi:flagellar biogenesis protein FliO